MLEKENTLPFPEQQVDKRKPFTMVMVTHNDNNLHHLERWKEALEDSLKRHATGTVLAFMEQPYAAKGFNETMTQLHDQGMPYSLALRRTAFEQKYPEGTDERKNKIEENTKDGKFELPSIESKFIQDTANIVDELDAAYPKRLRFVSEVHGDELVEKIRKDDEALEAWKTVDTREKFYRYIKAITPSTAIVQRERSDEIAPQLSEELSKETVVEGVGWIGALHTKLTHTLAREKDDSGEKKFAVKRIFPDKHEGSFYFHPLSKLKRERVFSPDFEITDDVVEMHASIVEESKKRIEEDKTNYVSPKERAESRQKHLAEAYKTIKKQRNT